MTDKFGKRLEVGDEVYYATVINGKPTLEYGTIKAISKDKRNRECTVGKTKHVQSHMMIRAD